MDHCFSKGQFPFDGFVVGFSGHSPFIDGVIFRIKTVPEGYSPWHQFVRQTLVIILLIYIYRFYSSLHILHTFLLHWNVLSKGNSLFPGGRPFQIRVVPCSTITKDYSSASNGPGGKSAGHIPFQIWRGGNSLITRVWSFC